MDQLKKRQTRVGNESSSRDSALGVNVVVLRGVVTSGPVERELPNGDVVTSLDVATQTVEGRLLVPVVTVDQTVSVDEGDEVVVLGQVRRRFFRAGSGVQSRTEVVAGKVIRASQVARVRKAVSDAAEAVREVSAS